MALISCPSCKKKISDKAESCTHCQLNIAELDTDKINYLKKVSAVEKSQKLMTQSFIAMLLFCGGFLFFYWYEVQPGTWQYIVSIASAGTGFVFYIITRFRLLLLKRSRS